VGMFFQTVKMIWWMVIRRCGPGRELGAGVEGCHPVCVVNWVECAVVVPEWGGLAWRV
jgi:hypothetical protein